MSEKSILAGFKILDLGQYIAGPYAARLFADGGAEVIKIEKPRKGDLARQSGPFPQNIPDSEKSSLFLALNTSKKGITLDITTAKGKALLLQLISHADALIENFNPRFLPSLGLTYQDLEKINSKLVMTSISNFGQDGPYADFEATEIVFQAAGGLMAFTGEPDKEPLMVGVPLAQYLAGLTAYTSTLAALYHAGSTGEGQHVDIAIYDAIPPNMDVRAFSWSMDPAKVRTVRTGERRGPLVGIYECQDGFIGCVVPTFSVLKKLAPVISPEIDDPEKYGDYDWGRGKNMPDMEAIVVPWFFEQTKREAMAKAQELGLPWSYVAGIPDIFNNPQLISRKSLAEVEHPRAGKYPCLLPCNRFDGFGYQPGPAPLLGQHNSDVFRNWLGLDEKQVGELAEEGII